MSDDLDPFAVTVSRSGEGEHAEPEVTMGAVTLSINQQGELTVEGSHGSRTFGRGGWHDLNVVRMAPSPKDA